MSGLVVSNLSKSYGDHRAVISASLTVPAGAVVALVGANGAGKSTLVRSILGIERSEFSQLTINGEPLTRIRADRYRGIGYASQETAVYDLLSVSDNLMLWLRLRGIRGRDAAHRLDHALDHFGLGSLRNRRADGLSGGERRRLHVASAMLDCGRLLLLDEPTLGADFGATDAVLEEILAVAEAGAAVLVTTHHMKEVARLRAPVVPIVNGRTRNRISAERLGSDLDQFDEQIRSALAQDAR